MQPQFRPLRILVAVLVFLAVVLLGATGITDYCISIPVHDPLPSRCDALLLAPIFAAAVAAIIGGWQANPRVAAFTAIFSVAVGLVLGVELHYLHYWYGADTLAAVKRAFIGCLIPAGIIAAATGVVTRKRHEL